MPEGRKAKTEFSANDRKKEEKRRKPKKREEKRQHVMLGSGQESQSTLQHRAYFESGDDRRVF